MSAEQVRQALRARFSDCRRYAIAEEVGLTTGYSHRRLDMMVLDCYYSNGFRIDGFEIKVSTSDLRRELEDPEKHTAFFDVIDYYTLAVPPGIVDSLMEVIPLKWGILVVNEDGSTRYKRKPLALEDRKADKAVPRGFLASVVRAIQGRQPAAEELQNEYEKGLKKGEEIANNRHGYLIDRVKRDADKLEEYDKLCSRFNLWGEKVDENLDEFEAFRKMDLQKLYSYINLVTGKLDDIKTFIETIQKEAKI